MTRRGCVAGVMALVWWVVLVVVVACGTDGGADSGGAVVPAVTSDIEGDGADLGNTVATTPTPTPASLYQPMSDVSALTDNLATATPSPDGDVEGHGYEEAYTSFEWYVPPSLDEQIFYSDVIVRATLKSATSTTETVPGEGGSAATYLPVQELRFTVHEYLKGSGPSDTLVAVRGDKAYATVAEARLIADASMYHRNTTWDGRQGVLFLRTLDGKASDYWSSSYVAQYASPNAVSGSSGATTTTAFTIYTGAPYEEWWDYTVDTLSRAWLPAGDTTVSGSSEGVSGATSVVFIEDGSKTPYSTVTLGEIRTKITAMAATLKAGEGIAGYKRCIRGKITQERMNRAYPWAPLRYKATLASGSAAGTAVFRELDDDGELKYIRYYVTGPDKDYFQAPIVDEDSDPSNGYFYTLSTTRPLLAGTYSVKHHLQHYTDYPCDYEADDSNYEEWTVTVTAPAGTVHEAFFDPAATALGVGTSGGEGVISPASFNVGGATTTITRLTSSSDGGMVVMTVSPSVSLSGKYVEFIRLDGSVGARLWFDAGDLGGGGGTSTAEIAAEVAAGDKVYVWVVSGALWKVGDKLMLRIR